MMKKRILWVSHLVPYPPKGGVLMRSYYLLRELGRHHDVDVFAINQHRLLKSYFQDEGEGLHSAREATSQFLRALYVVPEPNKGRFARFLCVFRSLFGMPYSVRWLFSREIREAIARRVSEGNYDVIHYDTIGLACYFHNHAAPAVLDHHNIESHMMLRRARKEKNWIKKAYFWQEGVRLRRYERANVAKFSHHFVCSKEDASRLKEIDRSLSITVVPNAVPVAPLINCRRERQKVIFVGGMNWYPNHDAVVHLLEDIWPIVLESCPQASLDVIGKAPSEHIKRLARQGRNITLHGFVDDIESFYAEARVFVCPIRDGGGTKLKVLDAFSHGVPLVAHAMACEGLDVISGVHALVGTSAAEIAHSVVTLLHDAELASRLGEEGYRLAKSEYCVEEVGSRLAQVFSSYGVAVRDGQSEQIYC